MVPVDTALVESFHRTGYARLGRVFDDAYLQRLRTRADDLMLGRVVYPGLFFQCDAASGRYEDLSHGRGWVGPTLNYRKLEKLELDPLFRAHIEAPEFAEIVGRFIDGPAVIYRTVLFNKSADGGSPLPWHQDAGAFWGIDPDPFLQVWTALDDCGANAGCLEVLPGSHLGGRATPQGGVVPDALTEPRASEVIPLVAKAGEVILVHNHLWHRAGLNQSGRPRRTCSISYMTAETRCLRKKRAPRTFLPVFADR